MRRPAIAMIEHGVIILGLDIIILALGIIIVAPPSKISRNFSGTLDAYTSCQTDARSRGTGPHDFSRWFFTLLVIP
jgi:hypothetical protein